MCSAVFITGLNPEFAAENVGYFTSPYPCPDHLFLHTGGVDSFHYAATRPLQWPPDWTLPRHPSGAYQSLGPPCSGRAWGALSIVPAACALRQDRHPDDGHRNRTVRKLPRAGIWGRFRTQLGASWNLYPQDGVWNGERILPQGYVKFVGTLAPAWNADGRPTYGAFFWINGDGTFPGRRMLATCPVRVGRPRSSSRRTILSSYYGTLQGCRARSGEPQEGAGTSDAGSAEEQLARGDGRFGSIATSAAPGHLAGGAG